MLQVKTRTLLAIAGVFWLIAGVNVAVVGVRAYAVATAGATPWVIALLAAGTAAVFVLFFFRIFKPYSAKHARRVDEMVEPRVSALRFMDRKGYIMIAFMIALGAGLRLSGFVPDWFIAFFYVGLGVALALTGALFLVDWGKRG
ncbi:MAG: hypothetical protein J6D25_03820 [Eggerthellaceae bacterium]|nr:hypothetical protein [Eggerthellaceae bacterium]